MSLFVALLGGLGGRVVLACSDLHGSSPTFVRLESNLFFRAFFFRSLGQWVC
jgi:hypothetical protein